MAPQTKMHQIEEGQFGTFTCFGAADREANLKNAKITDEQELKEKLKYNSRPWHGVQL